MLYGEGVLEIFRTALASYAPLTIITLPSAEDIYVSPAQIRRFDLKKGDTLCGTIRPPKDKEKYFRLAESR